MILATLVGYLAVLMAIGAWSSRRSADVDAYFIGSRGLGACVAALSYAAGSSSAWSILGVSGIAYSQGLSAVWLLPGTLTGHVVVWFYLAPRLMRLAHDQQLMTLSEVLGGSLEVRWRRRFMVLSAAVITFSFIFYVAAQFQGTATTFEAAFGLDTTASLLLGVIIVVAYTLLGGFWAVSLTDAVQAVIMLVCALVLPAWAIADAGGWEPFRVQLVQNATSGELDWLGGAAGWTAAGFVLGMLAIGFGPLGQPHLQNRIMALRDHGALRWARWVSLTWFVAVLGGMFLVGLAGHVYALEAADAEQVFFVVARQLVPPALAGVMVAAVLSAIMSTADSQLLVAASALTVDQGQRSLGRARIVLVLIAVAAGALAMFLPEAVFSRVLFAWNALGAAFGPALVARLAGVSVPGPWLTSSVAAGFGLTVICYLLPDGPGDAYERALPFAVASVLLWTGARAERSAAPVTRQMG